MRPSVVHPEHLEIARSWRQFLAKEKGSLLAAAVPSDQDVAQLVADVQRIATEQAIRELFRA